jgi:hypothetical protein
VEQLQQKMELLTKAAKDYQVEFKKPGDSKLIQDTIRDAKSLEIQLLRLTTDITPNRKAIKPIINVIPNYVFDKKDPLKLQKELEEKIEKLREELKKMGAKEVFNIHTNAMVSIDSAKLDPESMKRSKDMIKVQVDAYSAAIHDIALEGLAAIGEGLGDALSGVEGLGGIFNRVGTVLGGAMKDFGKQMIESGLVFLIAQKALKSGAIFSNPYVAIAAGVALIAVGTALQNKLNKKGRSVGGFADGGAAYGPMLAWVGESPRTSRSNPELFARTDQMQSIVSRIMGDSFRNNMGKYALQMNNGSTAVLSGDVSFEIHGDRLVGLLRRTEARQGRNF